ncbi:tRNA-dihydrouridine synthase A [Crenothrix polyspora]|uniref:tRNA-dihydrouridine(20/20a) synthase n=1 Tax=Crenothrix polyspora TaxID=360316 RepID=A0A1R4HGT8_9GAMM|nr:tRNA dihydrouridine(20/20a) synthase DusA [Crenothrix polyspora]SJM95443.1 tRNA-dihydrouridine synthase A [Crenothrix polyspora]
MPINPPINRTFCVAPMMDWTDRHCRYFHRLISQHALLYTEMVTTGALIHGDRHRFLQFNHEENPLALQLGGSNPQDLAICAKMAEDYGYDEVNLNVGCPSERVQNGRFGACLMAEPDLVAECVAAMKHEVTIPITVKSRIGVDDKDSYQELVSFVAKIAQAGCETFIVHARKAWLSGLSPKQNREVPPLRYDLVYQLKTDFPHLEIILNGGITTLEQADEVLQHVDGVMVGREAYHNPYLLADVDRRFYGVQREPLTREAILELLMAYIQQQLKTEVRLNSVTRHTLGLFHDMPGGRLWRRHISENVGKPGADETVLYKPLSVSVEEITDSG